MLCWLQDITLREAFAIRCYRSISQFFLCTPMLLDNLIP